MAQRASPSPFQTAMAASTSFSPAALGSRCCHQAFAADTARSPSIVSPSRAGDFSCSVSSKTLHFFHSNLFRSPSPARKSGQKLKTLCCNSVSDDAQASSSSTTPPPPPPTPSPSAPLESSSSEVADGSEQFPKEQRRRSQGARREAGSTDWISSSLSRRFGLAGGLAWVGFLAFGVISEQIKTRTEVFLEEKGTQTVEGAKEVVMDNNVKYVDVRTGGGASPFKGDLVLLDLKGKVQSTGEVFVDTASAKRPIAFVYGIKPYAKGVCYGLEYALQSMKAGGKRKVTVPADQCFGDAGEDLGNGMIVPGGAEIEYEVQLQRVSIAPS